MTTERIQRFRQNINAVQFQIEAAAKKSRRNSDEVRLVVVTKTHPIDVVRDAVAAGACLLGENYAEEAVEKIQTLGEQPGVEWHMIGHVQSRKARLVASHFAMMHSLDSIKLAGRLNRFAEESGRTLSVLVEVNVSGEESKFGFPVYNETLLNAFFRDVEVLLHFPHLALRGLMTMPPFVDDPETSRPHFRRLRELRDTLADRFPQVNWRELSMGTSADFAVAVEEGATLVRVGTAILGEREYV